MPDSTHPIAILAETVARIACREFASNGINDGIVCLNNCTFKEYNI